MCHSCPLNARNHKKMHVHHGNHSKRLVSCVKHERHILK